VVAYLLVFRYPEQTYDDVVAMVNERLVHKRHGIYPHVGLPEAIDRLRERWAATPGAIDAYYPDPAGNVVALAFASLVLDGDGMQMQHAIGVGANVEIQQGSHVRVRVTVEHTGAPPRGVFVYTNLNHDGPAFERIWMHSMPGTPATYEAALVAERVGEDFWLTAFATPRRYDHDLTRTWLGGDLRMRVTERTSNPPHA
jgi:hypothetical protein